MGLVWTARENLVFGFVILFLARVVILWRFSGGFGGGGTGFCGTGFGFGGGEEEWSEIDTEVDGVWFGEEIEEGEILGWIDGCGLESCKSFDGPEFGLGETLPGEFPSKPIWSPRGIDSLGIDELVAADDDIAEVDEVSDGDTCG